MDVVIEAAIAAIGQDVDAPAWRQLKAALLAKAPALADDIANLEQDAGSVSRQLDLADALADAGLAQDAGLLALALAILERRPASVPLRRQEAELAPDDNYALVPVFFATDRKPTGDARPARRFGAERAPLSYGVCQVSIPRDHRMGELESPSLWRLQFRDDPARHVVLLDASVQAAGEFFPALAARIAQSPDKSALLFVHGYNASFEDAARRTAQMAYDLGFEGAPVFYSWPSRGKLSGYLVDETNIEWAQSNLTTFLGEFLARTQAEHVYLIGHSMGNRALPQAAAAVLAQQPALGRRLREIILTAPDIDADLFRRDIVPALATARNPLTLYASSDDAALAMSQRIHGYPRAGDSGDGLVVMAGVETIDASGVDTSFIGHSYFAEGRSALADLFYLIRNNARADQRFGLQAVDGPDGRYWAFKP